MDRNFTLLAVVALAATARCAAFAQERDSAFSTAPINSKDSKITTEQDSTAPKTATTAADAIPRRQADTSVNTYLFAIKRIVANIFLVAGPIWAIWCFVVAGRKLTAKETGASTCIGAGVILCLITLLSLWAM